MSHNYASPLSVVLFGLCHNMDVYVLSLSVC